MTTLPTLTGYSGTVPDKATQTKEEFAVNVHTYLNYFNVVFTTEQIAHSSALNTLSTEIETLALQVTNDKNIVVAKEALMSPHYNAINTVAVDIENINSIATAIAPNIAAILQADDNASTATLKASEANDSAVAAEVSRLAAETIFDTFDDKWLGSKAANPTVDNDGDTLQDGAIFVKQITDAANEMYVYDLGLDKWVNMNFVPTAHSSLTGNANPDIHPISSINGLITELTAKAPQATTYTKDEVDTALANVSSAPTQAQIMAYSN